jgi:hypothetical protein
MRFRRGALGFALFAAGACLDLNTAPDNQSIDKTLAEINSLSYTLVAPAAAASQTIGQPELVGPISACPFDAASTFFTCPRVSIALASAVFDSLTRTYQLKDAASVVLSAYDAKTVASMHETYDRSKLEETSGVTGTTTFATTTHADLTLSALLSSTHTTSGIGTTTVVVTNASQSTTYATTFTLTNVASPQTPAGFVAPNWPNSGTVLYQYVKTLPGASPDTLVIDLTFTSATAASYLMFHAGTSKPGTCTLERSNSVLVTANCALTP